MGPEGPMGPQGPAGNGSSSGSGMEFLRYDFKVTPKEWELVKTDEGENYFVSHWDFPELTAIMCEEGAVIGYMYWDKGECQAPLPHVLHKKDGETLYTKTLDFDFGPGYVNFYCTYSDFYSDEAPDTETFKIVVYYTVD